MSHYFIRDNAFLMLDPQFPSAGVGPPGPKDALAPSNAPDFLDRH